MILRRQEHFPGKQQAGSRDLLHGAEGAHASHRPEMPRDPTDRTWPEASFLPGTCKALGDLRGCSSTAGMPWDVQGTQPWLPPKARS